MPEDIPKAVMVLIWLLVGLIGFGYLLWIEMVLYSFVFAVLFYGLPVLIYSKFIKSDEAESS